MMRRLSASGRFGVPRWNPPRPIADTRSPVRPSARMGMLTLTRSFGMADATFLAGERAALPMLSFLYPQPSFGCFRNSQDSVHSGWEPLSRLTRRTSDANDPHETSLRPVRPRTGPPPGGLRPRLRGSYADPERGDPRGPRRSRRHRHRADRVRKDGRVPLADPAETVEATSGANPRPRPLADPRARGPDRGRPPWPGQGDPDPRSRRVRRRRDGRTGARSPRRGRRRRRDPRPSPRPHVPAQRRLPRPPGPRPRRGGSHARHGLPAGRPPDRRCAPAGPPDPPLLGDDAAGDRGPVPDDHAEPRPDLGLPAPPASHDDPPRGLPGPAAPEDVPPGPAPRSRGHDVRPRVRPHQPAGGPPSPAGRPGRFRGRPDPRGPEPESAGDRPRRLPERTAPDPDRDRCRGSRHRRRGHLPCDQLRHPDRRHGLRAPGRADGAHGGAGRGDHVRDAGGRRRPARDRAGPRPDDSPGDAPGFRLPRTAASEGPRTRRRAILETAAPRQPETAPPVLTLRSISPYAVRCQFAPEVIVK